MDRYLVGLPNGAQPAKIPATILIVFKMPGAPATPRLPKFGSRIRRQCAYLR